MILARYIAGRYLRFFLAVTAGLAAILFFVELVEQLRRFGGAGVGLPGAAGLALLMLPGTFYGVLPLIALLAAIGMFLALSRSSELIAIRASGRSALRFLIAPLLAAAAAGALAVAVLNPIVAGTAKRYGAVTEPLQAGARQTVSLGENAVWLRQAVGGPGGEAQMVIRAARAAPDATVLHEAEFLVFAPAAGPGSGPVRRLAARTATLTPGAWRLEDVREWQLGEPNPEAAAVTRASLELPSDLTPERIRDGFGAPESVPVWQLPRFIAGLERAGFSARRHRVWLASELAKPALTAAMVLVAAAFTLRQLRGRRTGALVLAAFGAGLVLFFLCHFARVLGDNGDLPPALAAWAPPAAGAALALGRLLRLEE